MILQIEGFEASISISAERPAELVIKNKVVFSRIVASLISEQGVYSIEPYRLFYEDGSTIAQKGALCILESPFTLPWDHRQLLGSLHQTMEARLLEDDDLRLRIESLDRNLRKSIQEFGFGFQSDYSFSVEWDVKKYLKAFGFKIEPMDDASLLDNVIEFFALASDVAFNRPMILIGFNNYFEKKELETLVEQAIFLRIPLLFLEASPTSLEDGFINRYTIDQQLLES